MVRRTSAEAPRPSAPRRLGRPWPPDDAPAAALPLGATTSSPRCRRSTERLAPRRADDDRARRRRRAAAEDRGPPAARGLVRPRDAGPPARRRRRRRGRPARDQVGRRVRREQRASGCRRSTRWSSSTTRRPACPTAILDGGPITAQRTAAVSGVAIRRFAPAGRRPSDAGRADRGRRPGPEPPAGPRARPAGRRARDLRPASGPGGGAGRALARDTAGIGATRVAPIGTGRGRRRGRRRDRRLVHRPVRAPADDRRLADRRRARGARRLRHDGRRRGRPRRGPLPRRRPRPVPGQPRCRAVRRLPGPDGDARRGDPGRHAASGRGARRRHPPRRRSRRRDLRRRDPAPRRARPASASSCPDDESTRHPARPMSSWWVPGRWAPGPRSVRSGPA